MPDFVSGPTIGPESLAAAGNVRTTAAGGKEIHIDSGILRSQYEAGGAQVTDPNFSPALIEGRPAIGDAVAADSTAELMSPEMMRAVMSGQPPDPKLMAQIATPAARPVQARPMLHGPVRLAEQRPESYGPIELRVPVGGGIVASVTFSGEPKAKHWKRLLAHIEIEADPDNEFEESVETPATRQEKEPSSSSESLRHRGRKRKEE